MMKKLIAAGSCLCAVLALGACVSTKAAAPAADMPAADKPAAAAEATDAKPAGIPSDTEPVKILDNFEDGNFWMCMENTGAMIADVTDQHITDGASGGIWEHKDSEWSGFYCNQLAVDDWTGYTSVTIDAYVENPGKIGIIMVVMNGDWVWQQSTTAVFAESGKQQTLTFPITKGAITNTKLGAPVDAITGVEKITYLGFAVVGPGGDKTGAKAGKLFVDKITLVK